MREQRRPHDEVVEAVPVPVDGGEGLTEPAAVLLAVQPEVVLLEEDAVGAGEAGLNGGVCE